MQIDRCEIEAIMLGKLGTRKILSRIWLKYSKKMKLQNQKIIYSFQLLTEWANEQKTFPSLGH